MIALFSSQGYFCAIATPHMNRYALQHISVPMIVMAQLEVEAWSVRNSGNKGLFTRLVYKLLLEVIMLHRSVPLGLG